MLKRTHIKNCLAAVFLQVGLASLAHADEIPVDWKSPRALGMGNSFSAVSNDETAVFSNPAGLTRTRNPRARRMLHLLSFPGISVLANSQAAKTLQKNPQTLKENLSKLTEVAIQSPDKPVHLETQVYPATILGNRKTATYLIGIPIRSVTNISIPDAETSPTVAKISSVNTASMVLGIAGSSTRGGLNYGLSVRPNYRYSFIQENYDIATVGFSGLVNGVKSNSVKTTATAIDLGFMYVVPDYWMPTIGISILNVPTGCVKDYVNPVSGKLQTVCGTVRTGGGKSPYNADRLDPTDIRLGFSMTPRMKFGSQRVNLRLSADAYPLPIKSGSTFYGVGDLYLNKMLHGGVELSFGNAFIDEGFSLRAGVSQGMPTYGASIEFLGLVLEYAQYSEDVGEHSLRRADTRHLLGLSTHW